MRRPHHHDDPDRHHGEDTLKVLTGRVVAVYGDDVFVELGPRMQGVISVRQFDAPPAEGDLFDFTLRGREEGLWALSLAGSGALTTWEELEIGSLVQARVTGKNHGGLELKIGPLHAFMPRSEVGIPREQKLNPFLGRTLTCEVIEVDDEAQRAVVSRKRVIKREKESRMQRMVGSLRPGIVVSGRVTRIEPYGAFVNLGHGLTGLIHVSDLSLDRIEHPSEVVKKGDHLECKVLSIKQGGKRIGLGLKQMQQNPWKSLLDRVSIGELVEGRVAALAGYGAFVEIERGVEGLLHVSQMGLPEGRTVQQEFNQGDRLSVRIVAVDAERERLSLSLLHTNGRRIQVDEARAAGWFSALEQPRRSEEGEDGELGTNVGDLFRRALDDRRDKEDCA